MMIRRPWLTVLGAACASFAAAAPARGAPATAVLEATAGAGADDCPKGAALAATVNDGLGRAALTPAGRDGVDGTALRVLVHFERAQKGYAANVNVGGGRGGTRKLSDAGPKCATLGNAVGVLLELLLDADAETLRDAAAGATPTTTERATGGSGAVAHATTAGLAVGGGVAEGLVGGWSPTIGLGGTLAYDRWSARLGGVWLPEKVNDYGPGRIEVGLAFARLALCGSTRVDRSSVTMALCAQQQVGWLRGQGFGYPAANTSADQMWLAAGASIVASGAFERSFGWEAEAGVVRLLRQQRFVVDNLGTGFQSDPWAFTMTLAFTTRLW
jgi:hypothetical protein